VEQERAEVCLKWPHIALPIIEDRQVAPVGDMHSHQANRAFIAARERKALGEQRET